MIDDHLFLLRYWRLGSFHLNGRIPFVQIPQVLPFANLMNPFSPQFVPHEFCTFQFSWICPTKFTAWFKLVPQFEKIPLAYLDQFVASTKTETGPLWIAVDKSLQLFIVVYPEILNSPVVIAHVCWRLTKGYLSAVVIPWSLTHLNPVSAKPPLQPWPAIVAQSISCWSDKSFNVPSAILLSPCKGPVVENTQAGEHWPWFLIGPTAPFWVQSMSPALRFSVD
jgi:hypothetical protein